MWEIHADGIMMPLISLIDFRDFPSPFRRLEDLHVRGIFCLSTQQENQFISVYEQGIMMTVHICKHTKKKESIIFFITSVTFLHYQTYLSLKTIWISINKTFQFYPSLWTEKMKHGQIYGLLKPEFQDKSLELRRYLLSPSDMHRMCSFLYFLSFSSACSCFIQVMMVKCLCRVWLKRFSGTSTALLSPSK